MTKGIVVFIAGAVSLGLILLDIQPVWIQVLGFGIAAILFLMALFQELPKPEILRRSFGKHALVLTLLPFLIIATWIARKYETVIDVSRAKQYSLRSETQEWLKKIKEPVRILIFLRSDDKTIPYAEWLDKQMKTVTPLVTMEIKNINRDVSLAQRYGVKLTGEAVLLSGENWLKVGSFKENALLRGLIRLLSRTASSICVLSGHGELDIEDTGPDGLAGVKKFLVEFGYDLQTVSLIQTDPDTLRQTCAALLIASPKLSLAAEEETRLKDLLARPLPIFFALDTPLSPSFGTILKEEGLSLSSSWVVNPENVAKKFPVTAIWASPTNQTPFSRTLTQPLYFPDVSAIHLKDPAPLQWVSAVMLPPGGPFRLMGKEANTGPFALAVYGNRGPEKKTGRIVVGSAKWLKERYFTIGDNQNFLLNGLRFLMGEDEEIHALPSLEDEERRLIITDDEKTWIKNASFYLFPATAFAICLAIRLRRIRQS